MKCFCHFDFCICHSGITGGGQWVRVPPETSDREISAHLLGKEARKKWEKGGGKWRRKEGKV